MINETFRKETVMILNRAAIKELNKARIDYGKQNKITIRIGLTKIKNVDQKDPNKAVYRIRVECDKIFYLEDFFKRLGFINKFVKMK